MVSVCTVPAGGGRSCERFGGYTTINRIPLPLPFYSSSSGVPPNFVEDSGGDECLLVRKVGEYERQRVNLLKG